MKKFPSLCVCVGLVFNLPDACCFYIFSPFALMPRDMGRGAVGPYIFSVGSLLFEILTRRVCLSLVNYTCLESCFCW